MSTRAQLAGAVSLTLLAAAGAVCSAPTTLTCSQVTTAVTFDADLREWAGVAGITTPMRTQHGVDWAAGNAVYKCSYNTTHINFAMQVPGAYMFDNTTSHRCTVVSLMFKVGADATHWNMGGCSAGQNKSMCGELFSSGTCAKNTVDLMRFGGKNFQRGKASSAHRDEYGISPYCRLVDNKTNPGGEWVGTWDHSDPKAMAMGNYTFELTRSLTTTSVAQDVQLAVDRTYSFGIAFYDPMQTTAGWTDEGHYITGCGLDWINLVVGNGMLNNDVRRPANGARDVRGRSAHAGLLFAMVGTGCLASTWWQSG